MCYLLCLGNSDIFKGVIDSLVMEEYIKKSALVAEIERIRRIEVTNNDVAYNGALDEIRYFINTLEVKEGDEQKEMMSECPFKKVGCEMYEGHILECKGACSWVVDYLKLKELKAQKGK